MKQRKLILTIAAVLALALVIVGAIFIGRSCKNSGGGNPDTSETNEALTSQVFDDEGNLVGKDGYYEDGSLKYHEEYNSQGKVDNSTIYNADGTVNKETNIKYDSNGNPSQYEDKKYNYDENGKLKDYDVTISDKDDNPIKTDKFDPDGNFQGSTNFDRDENGNVVVEKIIDENHVVEKIYYRTYDEKGILIEEKATSGSGKFYFLTKYEYDELGRMIKSTNYNEKGEISSYGIYEYVLGPNEPTLHKFVPDGKGGFVEY